MDNIKIVKISNIKPNPKNPRVIKDDKFLKLKKSLQDFPDMLNKRPLVCFTDTDKKLVVLGGNMRLKAAQDIGLKELPVMIADNWSDEERDQFIIKDNVGFGEWDYNELSNDWDTVKLIDWGVDIPDIDKIIKSTDINDLSSNIKQRFVVEIDCNDEGQQEFIYNESLSKGYQCRILTL